MVNWYNTIRSFREREKL